MYTGDLPKEWVVRILRNGVPMDLSASVLLAPVSDNGVELGHLDIDRADAIIGRLTLSLSESVYAAMSKYSTWRLREDSVFFVPVMQGRLVKES